MRFPTGETEMILLQSAHKFRELHFAFGHHQRVTRPPSFSEAWRDIGSSNHTLPTFAP